MKKYLTFKGRIGRLEFSGIVGLAISCILIFYYTFGFSFSYFQSGVPDVAEASFAKEVIAQVFECSVLFVTAWIMSAAWCKRLHDVGVSGWYQLILIVPLIKYMMLAVFFMPGDRKENKYGAWAG